MTLTDLCLMIRIIGSIEEIKDQPKKLSYSTVTDLSERVKLDLPKQILEFTITVSSNQLNQYNYTKQKRILTEPVISSMKLITV